MILYRLSGLLLAVVLFIGANAQPGAAQTETEKYVAEFAGRLISISSRGSNEEARRRPFYAALARYADLSRVSRVALGRYRKDLPAKHRATYNQLVTDFVADTLVEYSDGWNKATLKVKGSSKSGKAIIVRTAVNRSSVKWRVRKVGGRLRVTDVSLGGIWLSIGLRGRFTAILDSKKGNFDSLLKYLRENST